MAATINANDLYIANNGNDDWTGTLAEPNADGNDGPLKTIDGARKALRLRKANGEFNGPVTVWLRGGEYPIQKPVQFDATDSGPITFTSYPEEEAVISGGLAITGWQETNVNGVDAWVTDISTHLHRHGDFRCLFVNRERRQRPRLPKKDFFWMDDVPDIDIKNWKLFDGSKRFIAKEGDIQAWRNMADVDIVVMHFWIDERMKIDRFDEETRTVECDATSIFALTDDWSGRWAKYYVENIFEALTEPGEWYLDKGNEKLYYIPKEGETPDNVEIVAPCTQQWLRCIGDPTGKTVDWLRFDNLTFRYTDWKHACGLPVWYDPYRPESEWRHRDSWNHFIHNNGTDPSVNYATVPQGAIHLPGSIFFEGARNCAIENCRIEHAGFYAVDVGEGCTGLQFVGNHIHDFGAGGIKIDGGDHTAPHERRTGYTVITDNHIHNGGRIAGASTGVILVHSFGNLVAHNEIHDLFYTGISCGWVWGHAENVSRDNIIEKNHIYDLGKGVLNDMGGIYMLGVQPGTFIRNNVIHDVEKANYGGSGIYLDEGSSHMVVENNLSYNVTSHPFTHHFGRENIVRNNIFSCGAESQVNLGRGPHHDNGKAQFAFNLLRNIIITDDAPAGAFCSWDSKHPADVLPWFSACNLFWSTSGKPIEFHQGHEQNELRVTTLDELQEKGMDAGSIIADPKLADIANGDVGLANDSPALKLGFVPLDIADVGPRVR